MAKSKAPAIIGYGPFDKAIIRGFSSNLSAEEVSQAEPISGTLTPAQCLDRLIRLLESKDVLDVQQKRQLLVDNAYELLAKLKKQTDDAAYIDKDSATTYLKTLTTVMDMLDRANAQIEEAMLKFNSRRAQEMTLALQFIFERTFAVLAERNPTLGLEEAQEVVLEVIPASLPEVNQ